MKNLSILLVFILISCGTQKSVPTDNTSADSKIEFNILAVNDVYEIAALDNGRIGGMARVATVRDSLKKQNPNIFLFMAGDFLNPSLLGTLKVDGERVKGKQMIEVMNAMNFDLATFGNHEFDLKPEEFQQRLNESTFEWVSGNVQYNGGDIVAPFAKEVYNVRYAIPQSKTLKIVDEDGTHLNVGIVSVTTNSNPRQWVDYGDYIGDAQFSYSRIKDSIDLAVGFTHLSLKEDRELAKAMPQLPLIIGGHEHDNLNVSVGQTRIVKADANAKSAYLHQFTYDTESKDLDIKSTLIPITRKIPHQPQIKAIVDKWTAIQDEEIRKVIDNPYEVIYKAQTPLDGTDASGRSKQTNLGKLITKGMSYAYDDEVDAVFVNGGSFRIDDELTGDVSSFDMFRVLPFGGNLLKVKLKGSLLSEVLDYGKQSSGTGAYLQRLNLTQDANSGNWLIKGKPVQPNETYTIVTSDFLLKGYDIPMLTNDNEGVVEVEEPSEESLAGDIRRAVIAYLKSID